MTKQQAIWTLIDCRRLLIDGLVSVQKDYITEAFDMAIEALKAEPVICEECKHHNECCRGTIPTNPDEYCSDGERRTDEA